MLRQHLLTLLIFLFVEAVSFATCQLLSLVPCDTPESEKACEKFCALSQVTYCKNNGFVAYCRSKRFGIYAKDCNEEELKHCASLSHLVRCQDNHIQCDCHARILPNKLDYVFTNII